MLGTALGNANLEQGPHVFAIEQLLADRCKAGRNTGQIEIGPVTLGHEVEAQQVAGPLALQERGQ